MNTLTSDIFVLPWFLHIHIPLLSCSSKPMTSTGTLYISLGQLQAYLVTDAMAEERQRGVGAIIDLTRDEQAMYDNEM